jgi:hypothetical protein
MNPSIASKRLFSFLVALLFACAAPWASAQNGTTTTEEGDGAGSGDSDRKPGITVIVDISGKVELFEAEGKPAVIATKDMQVPVGATLVTGPGAFVNLALSNGALFQIQENSQFTIGEFEQESYQFAFNNGAVLKPQAAKNFEGGEAVLTQLDASAEAWNELEAEPTNSVSRFSLGYGTMVGNSKRLAPGSSMEIITPVGVAGIRGTTWRLTVQRTGPPGSNTFNVRLDVPEGTIQFGNSDGTRAVTVNQGFTLQANAIVEAAGQVRIQQLTNNPMTPEAAAALENIVNAVRQGQTVFTAIQGNPDILNRVDAANQATQQQQGQGAGDTGGPAIDRPPVIPPPFVPGGSGGIIPPTPTPNPSLP